MADSTQSETRVADALDEEALENDWILRGCSTAEHEGRRRPTLGRITLVSRLGRGGMGVVYRGVNPRLATDVAVKILPPALEQEHAGFVDRFVREARLAARLRSDHLVSVIDVDRDEATRCHFLVMEFVQGTTASQWLEEALANGRTGPREADALDVCIAATKGLAAAHAEDIVHRDVKPANVLIPTGDDGRPNLSRAKLADLGLARGESESDVSLTATKIALGTPGYMAPEQARDARGVGKPADVFSMGATLYALLTGEAPFRAPTPVEAIVRTVNGEFRPIRDLRADLSLATAVTVERCLAQDPADRFPDAIALLDALEACRTALGGDRAKADAAAEYVAALARNGASVSLPATPRLHGPAAPTPPRRQPEIARPVSSPNHRVLPEIPSRRGISAPTAIAVIAVAVIAAGAYFVWRSSNEPPAARPRLPAAVAHDGDAPPAPESNVEPPASSPTQEGTPQVTSEEAPTQEPLSPEAAPAPTKPIEPRRTQERVVREPPREPHESPAAPPPAASAPSRTELIDPVERAQDFDLTGLPAREDSYNVQQVKKLIASHRRGDLVSAVTIQRKLSTFYARIGDTTRAREARERAEFMEGVMRKRAAETAPREDAPKTNSPAGQPPAEGGAAPQPSPQPPSGGGFTPPPPPPPPPAPPPRR